MTAEEYRRQLKEQIKQEAKADLQKRKEFLNAVEQAKHSEKLRTAVEGLVPADDSDEWIAKLNHQTAVNEAKMEMALDTAITAEQERAAQLDAAKFEAERKAKAAADLVAQMRREMFGESPADKSAESAAEPPASQPNTPPANTPKKLGDF